jgi:hypothetical protein
MAIEVKCPNKSCDQQLALSPEMAGKRGKCPKCGKTFKIPEKLAQKARAAQQAAPQQTSPAAHRESKPADIIPASELAAYLADDDLFAAEPAPPPRRQRPAPTAEVIDDYEAGPVVDEPIYEEPRPVRRRRHSDYEEHEAEPYDEDEDDDVPRYGGKGSSGLSKTRRWKLGSVGFLILAIAMCVLGGSYVFLMLAEAFGQLYGAAQSQPLMKAAMTFVKISQIVWLLAMIGVVTGYSFCMFIPNKRATLGLTIAALSVCVVNLILGIVFRFVPVLAQRSITDFPQMRSVLAGWLGGKWKAGDEILTLFLELGIIAELMLLSLLLAEVARAQKDRHHKADCMRVVWFLTGLAGATFVMFMCMFFVEPSDFTARLGASGIELSSDKMWMVYMVRIFNWACNGLLVLSFVFLIMNLFFTRKSTA